MNFSHSHPPPLTATDLPGLITLETRRVIEDVISCGLLPAVFVVGLCGNVISLAVLCQQGLRDTTNVILVSLTVTDLLYVVLSLALDVKCLVGRVSPAAAVVVESVTKVSLVVLVFLLGRVSALYICLIAVERYIAVLLPLKASVLLTRKRVVLACVSLYFIGFTPSLCLFFVFDLQHHHHPVYNTTVPTIVFTRFFLDNFDFFNYYSNFVLAIVFRWLPIAIVAFCTGAILRSLRATRHQRHVLTSGTVQAKEEKKAAEERRVTKTLLSVCVLFIVCITPNIVLQVARILFAKDGFRDVGRYANVSAVVLSLVNLFSMLNSSLNFVLYILTSRKFAAVFCRLFLPCWRWRRADRETTTATGGVSVSSVTTRAEIDTDRE